ELRVGGLGGGIETAGIGRYFQRADCAPIATVGNGSIPIADWVQAGRYATGLDPVTPAGGPTGPSMLRPAAQKGGASPNASKRDDVSGLRVARGIGRKWGAASLTSFVIELEAQGNENAIGFSVSFDPMRFRFMGAALADGLAGAAFNVNLHQETGGRVGLALALPAGKGLLKGKYEIAVLTFIALSDNDVGANPIEFGDQPIVREIVDVNANAAPAVDSLNESPLVPDANQEQRRFGNTDAPGHKD